MRIDNAWWFLLKKRLEVWSVEELTVDEERKADELSLFIRKRSYCDIRGNKYALS